MIYHDELIRTRYAIRCVSVRVEIDLDSCVHQPVMMGEVLKRHDDPDVIKVK